MTDAPERIWAVTEPDDVSAQIMGEVYAQQTPDGMVGKPVEYTRADLAKPRVKPLVWRQYSINGNSEAQTAIGQYVVEDHGLNAWGVWLNDTHDPIIGPFNTLAAAKSAAQADYEARVLACLENRK